VESSGESAQKRQGMSKGREVQQRQARPTTIGKMMLRQNKEKGKLRKVADQRCGGKLGRKQKKRLADLKKEGKEREKTRREEKNSKK